MTEVTPEVGHYVVRVVDAQGVRTHLVGKDKRCSCGGNAERQCMHIRAVAEYLRAGGQRAPEARKGSFAVPDDGTAAAGSTQKACPICGGAVKRLGPGFWRCVDDPSHYWQWRAGENSGAIRKFLTQPHPAKQGPFYRLSEDERDFFLVRAAQRMHASGYTPHSP